MEECSWIAIKREYHESEGYWGSAVKKYKKNLSRCNDHQRTTNIQWVPINAHVGNIISTRLIFIENKVDAIWYLAIDHHKSLGREPGIGISRLFNLQRRKRLFTTEHQPLSNVEGLSFNCYLSTHCKKNHSLLFLLAAANHIFYVFHLETHQL